MRVRPTFFGGHSSLSDDADCVAGILAVRRAPARLSPPSTLLPARPLT